MSGVPPYSWLFFPEEMVTGLCTVPLDHVDFALGKTAEAMANAVVY